MKRSDALQKLSKICQRLDEIDPDDFYVIPLRLYLFGSLLIDKANPSDVDLLFQYQERSDLDPNEILNALIYGKPLPHEKAIIYLRNRMKMIRIELMSEKDDIATWLSQHMFSPETPVCLLWEPGLDWQAALNDSQLQLRPWDSELEQQNKFMQETVQKIMSEQGEDAAARWVKEERGKQHGFTQ